MSQSLQEEAEMKVFTPIKRDFKEGTFSIRLGSLMEPLKEMANETGIKPSELARQMIAYCLHQNGKLKHEYEDEEI